MFVGGTQRLTLQDAEGLKTKLFPSVRKGARICTIAFLLAPQQAYSDPPSRFFYPIRAGKPPSESTFIRAAPQLADLTLQGSFQEALRLGAKPTASPTIVSGAQSDTSQLASIWKAQPASALVPAAVPRFTGAAQADASQIAAGVWGAQPAPSIVPAVPAIAIGAPQVDPGQVAAQVWAPSSVPIVGSVAAAQYTWGTHAAALSGAEAAKSALFQPAAASVVVVVGPVATFVAIGPQNDLSQIAASVWAVSWDAGTSPPPPAPVPTAVGSGGVASWPLQDKYWQQLERHYKKKKKQAEKKSPAAVEIVEDIASRQASLAAALEILTDELQHARIKELTVYRDLLKLEFERKRYEEDMDDEDVILLALH